MYIDSIPKNQLNIEKSDSEFLYSLCDLSYEKF